MGKLYVIAELLLAEGARAETHTLENLVTHRSEKFWLSRDCPYVRTAVRQKWDSSTVTIGTSLILDIHFMINWQLSKQGIHRPVSRDHVAGSGQEVAVFF